MIRSSRHTPLPGPVFLPGTSEYDLTCDVFNGDVNRRPRLIVRPVAERDVWQALLYARERNWKVAVRNGGHSTRGQSLADGGLVIDMAALNRVEVLVPRRRARVQAGARLRDLDAAAIPFGLAIPSGDCPMVGITGLTLGGGNGFLSRLYGLTCDHLLSAKLVTAGGEILTVSKESHPDLFWALRGGGHGNFGVVTELEFRLREVPADVMGGEIFWPIEQAEYLLKKYRDLMHTAPDALNIHCRLNRELEGRPMVRLYGMYAGRPAEGQEWFERMLAWGRPYRSRVRAQPYASIQRINERSAESAVAAKPCFHWNSVIVEQPLTDLSLKAMLDAFASCPTPFGRINLDALGGAINRVPAEATAFVHRNARYIASLIGVWFDPADKEASCRWADQTLARLRPHWGSGAYQNYAYPAGEALENACFGTQLPRLRRLKSQWDPDHMLQGSLGQVSGNERDDAGD